MCVSRRPNEGTAAALELVPVSILVKAFDPPPKRFFSVNVPESIGRTRHACFDWIISLQRQNQYSKQRGSVAFSTQITLKDPPMRPFWRFHHGCDPLQWTRIFAQPRICLCTCVSYTVDVDVAPIQCGPATFERSASWFYCSTNSFLIPPPPPLLPSPPLPLPRPLPPIRSKEMLGLLPMPSFPSTSSCSLTPKSFFKAASVFFLWRENFCLICLKRAEGVVRVCLMERRCHPFGLN